MDKEIKETLELEKLICTYVNRGQYLGAFLLLQEQLRKQAKEGSLIEDKREPITE